MQRFKRVLVNLALDDQDEALLSYTNKIVGPAKSEKVYAVHLADNLEVPEEIRSQYQSILEPADEFIAGEIREKIKLRLTAGVDTDVLVISKHGSALDEILRLAVEKDVDLIVVGRRPETKESGTLAEKLTRTAPCSVLTVPCCTTGDFGKILLPLDFTENAGYAFDVATAWGAALKAKTIFPLCVYNVPAGFHKSGKTHEQFAAIMEKNARNEYEKFIKVMDLRGVALEPRFVLGDNIAKTILDEILKTHAELLVMGTRGRSGGVASLLGTTTERVLSQTDIPLLAVKQKGSGIGLLRMLLEL
ncbi:MAG: universal stress protein [Spirochaetes bacterium]|nr:universal stress protein [Spirochaetota bacterium]